MNICFNGLFYPAGAPVLPIQNRSYKWGDGLFETAKVFAGKWLLEDMHFERLLAGLRLLQIEREEALTQSKIVSDALALCSQNKCLQQARIRLAVFRNEENKAVYSIEAIPLDEKVNAWQEEGLIIVLYPYARKSMDAFANLKSANFLPYVLAQQYAAEKGADDALVLNAQNFLCDSSKANLFLLKGKTIYTPALHQGCINGVMRRVVIEEAKKMGYGLHQCEVDEQQLLAADEVFLTNAVQIIRWVESYKNAHYTCKQTRKIFEAVSATIFAGLC